MEKHLATTAYWIGILCTAIAVITRGLALMGMFVFSSTYTQGRNPMSYRTFLEGAVLFFLMAIASAWIASNRQQKA